MTEQHGVVPSRLDVPEADLDDLRRRLGRTRWPGRATAAGWEQGVPLERLQELCEHWRTGYDWRRCESRLNSLGQARTVVDGLGIHLLHIRSPEPDALPMIMTHGWPGSVVEFDRVVGPLTDPAAHGADPSDAFHLVVPSLPGFGFSDRPAGPGWGVEATAMAWVALMDRLGYARWVAQGTDWGAVVTAALAAAGPPGLAGAHLSTLTVGPRPGHDRRLSGQDRRRAAASQQRFGAREFAYAQLQATRPQTLAYALTDSPAAQAAWLYEKLWAWSDHDGDLSTLISDDQALDDVMLYWLSATGGSSAQLYWESLASADMARDIAVPMGVSVSPADTTSAPEAWARQWFHDLVFWSEPARGGHFAAWEQPQSFVQDLRDCFRLMR